MPGVHPVFVKSESGATVLVPIRPLVLGEIPIFVKANSDAVSDSVHTTVLVKVRSEKFPQSQNSSNNQFGLKIHLFVIFVEL